MYEMINRAYLSFMTFMGNNLPFLDETAGSLKESTGGQLGSKILRYVGGIGGALIAVALIISIVKDALGYMKGTGQNSIGKIIGKVIFLMVMIAIVVMAVNWDKFSTLGTTIADKGQGVLTDVANQF